MRLPTWDELSSDEEQLEVLEAPLDQALYVIGPPGSGKTSLAVWRGEALAELYGQIPVITYNRMLRRSLQLVADDNDISIRASTMHSYVWRDFRARTGNEPPAMPKDSFAYRWEAISNDLVGVRPNKEALVVDEGQDLPVGFFGYASQFVAKALTVFADEEQAISGNHSTIEQIQRAGGLPDPIILSENHRNTPEVARVAEHFHTGRLPTATVIRSGSGDVPRLIRTKDHDSTISLIINEFHNRSGSIGVIVDQQAVGEAVQSSVRELLPSNRVDRYSYELQNDDSIDVRSPGITVLNKESVKGQEFDTVFVLELDRFIPCTNDAELRAMYMMCARARDNLFLVCGPEPLSADAEASLPGHEVLER
ncbi:MAG: AAA family ATPase [Gammaproteobacteria bacterium]|nr:AAA family ATPase [Gammaproteobacteria bacterium]MDE0226681.1 AAA family ATPase [Gammaproteobacteria bacterium]MDE0452858.1 AAA family ATPase [Gammaproteobacteria bacterium]